MKNDQKLDFAPFPPPPKKWSTLNKRVSEWQNIAQVLRLVEKGLKHSLPDTVERESRVRQN